MQLKMLSDQIFEILQICIILFIFSFFASFCLSNFFGLMDNEIDKIEDKSSKNTAIVFLTFFQLFITCIVYFSADMLLNYIKPWKETFRKFTGQKYVDIKLGQLNTAEYGLHIILIILLIEMNSSLKENLHKMANIIHLDKKQH
jgi:magnesium-transporting ATPase (P-type)